MSDFHTAEFFPSGTPNEQGATVVNLAEAVTVIQDPNGYASAMTAGAVTTGTEGSSSSVNLSQMEIRELPGSVADGVYTWELARLNPGNLDRIGLNLGFIDSASLSRSILGGMFETASSRELNHAQAASLSYETQATLTRVRVSVRLGTDKDGKRLIGPGWIEGFNGSTKVSSLAMKDQHVVTGTLHKVVGIRRGTAGVTANFAYSLTEEVHP